MRLAQGMLRGHTVKQAIIDDPHQPRLLLDPDADLSGILACHAVLHDFDEDHSDGSGDPATRAALVAQLVDEVLPLAHTDEERVAIRMASRPGLWLGSDLADGRALTQDQTDAMVRFEIERTAALGPTAQHRAIRDAIGEPVDLEMDVAVDRYEHVARTRAVSQRAGVDSDPLVRLLAYRIWGLRDERWHDWRRPRGELNGNGDIMVNVPLTGMTLARGGSGDSVGLLTGDNMHAGMSTGLSWNSSASYRVGDVLRAAGEEYLVASVGHTAMMREGMVRASTRRERRPQPVPKWAKVKKSHASRPGR